MNGHEVV